MSQKVENKKLAIITAFMGYTLENDHYPKSVYKFCKTAKIEEKDFYNVFSSLDAVRECVWEVFFTNAMQVLEKGRTLKWDHVEKNY